MTINLDVAAWERLARTLAGQSQLTIKYKAGQHPCTDGRTVYLPPPPTKGKDALLIWAGYAFHEIGHNVPAMRDCFGLIKKYDVNMRSFYGVCLNLVDDYRQERYQRGAFEGRDKALSFLHGHTLREGMEALPDNPDRKQLIMYTLFLWDTMNRETWQPDVIGAIEQMLAAAPLAHEQVGWLKALQEYNHRYNTLTTAEEEKTLVDDILREVFSIEDEELEQLQISVEAAGEEGEEPQDSMAPYKELLKHQHDEEQGGASYHRFAIDYTQEWERGDMQWQQEKVVKQFSYKQDSRYAQETAGYTSTLAGTVRKLLQVKSQSYREGGHKRGKLHKRALYKVPAGTKEVFSKPRQALALDVAVSLLVDCSGSMGGSKWATAIKASKALTEALNSNNIRTAVTGFTTHHYQPMHYRFQEWGERVDVVPRMCSTTVDMNGNNDGMSIVYAARQLKQQREKRKVLIVISDGQPAATGGDAMSYCQEVVKAVEKEGLVEVYAIGVEDASVSLIYSNYTLIDRAEELEAALLQLIRKVTGL